MIYLDEYNESDKIILTNAWSRLNSNPQIPFQIINANGCSGIESLVKQKNSILEIKSKIFTLCDYDNEGVSLQRNKFHCGKTGKNPSKHSGVIYILSRILNQKFYIYSLFGNDKPWKSIAMFITPSLV